MAGTEYPPPAARVARLAEMLDAVTALLRGEVVTRHGRHIHLRRGVPPGTASRAGADTAPRRRQRPRAWRVGTNSDVCVGKGAHALVCPGRRLLAAWM